MADVSDPLELGIPQTPEGASEETLRELRELVGEYSQVKDLFLQPGWAAVLHALEKRSAFWKERSLELLTSILLRNDKSNDAAFADARIHHLATEEAINILLVMRVDARDAQEKLDKMAADVKESPQNG